MTDYQPNNDHTHWAFISYRHADNNEQDRGWASWLHQEIERYEVPAELVGTKNERGDTIPERIYPVFRDEESLPADADLANSISTALDKSRFLTVLCSPRAVESQYVSQEIEHFKESGKSNRIIAAIIAGEPGDKDNECFPVPLREVVTPDGKLSEPIAADFRLPNGEEGFTSSEAYKRQLLKTLSKKQAYKQAEAYDERLQLMKLKIIAGILGVGIETLRDRDKAYQLAKQKKRAKQLRKWLAATSLLAVAAVGGGVIAWANQQKATKQTALANEALSEKQQEYNRAEAEKQRALEEEKKANSATKRAINNKKLADKNRDEALEAARQAEIQTKIALKNEKLTKNTLSHSAYERACELETRGEGNAALAYLAKSLRENPDNLSSARMAIMLLQENRWYAPSQQLPELNKKMKGQLVDATFTGKMNWVYLTVDKKFIYVYSKEGKLLHPPKRNHDKYESFSPKFIPEEMAYCTKTSNNKLQYWNLYTGAKKQLSKNHLYHQNRHNQFEVKSLGHRQDHDVSLLYEIYVEAGGHSEKYGNRGYKIVVNNEFDADWIKTTNTIIDEDIGSNVRFLPDQKTFLIDSSIWRNNGQLQNSIGDQYPTAVSPDGLNILSSTSISSRIGRPLPTLCLSDHSRDIPQIKDSSDLPHEESWMTSNTEGNEKIIVSKDNKKTLNLKESKTHKQLYVNFPASIILSSDSKFVRIWSIQNGNLLKKIPLKKDQYLADYYQLAFDPRYFAIVNEVSDSTDFWNISTLTKQVSYNRSDVRGFSSSPDSNTILYSTGRSVDVIDCITGTQKGETLNLEGQAFVFGEFSADSSYFILRGADGGSGRYFFQFWDSSTIKPISQIWTASDITYDPMFDDCGSLGYSFDKKNRALRQMCMMVFVARESGINPRLPSTSKFTRTPM